MAKLHLQNRKGWTVSELKYVTHSLIIYFYSFILAYATPKGNSATGAVEGNTGGAEGDVAENGQGGEEEMANYDEEEEGENGGDQNRGGGMDSESIIHGQRRGPNQGILNLFLALRRRRNEEKRNSTII